MFREKLFTTLGWSTIPIVGALLADYLLTVALLHDFQEYTPFLTLCIATVVALPTTYALVSSRINLRRLRDDLAVARDAAVEANRTKTLFFANMSHELRTPLNAILGFSELQTLEVFAAKRVEYARLIHSSGSHLLSLVNDLLDLSRIEAGQLELHNQSLSLAELIEDCIETAIIRARSRELRVLRDVQSPLPMVNGDWRALKQILLNLLTNAIKFSSPGGAIEIFAKLTASGDLAFGVKDEGIGIAEDEQARVFERFSQIRHHIAGVEKGTGLGLPIVRGLAKAHGGDVAMESRIGEGTCVTVTLPGHRLEHRPPTALAS